MLCLGTARAAEALRIEDTDAGWTVMVGATELDAQAVATRLHDTQTLHDMKISARHAKRDQTIQVLVGSALIASAGIPLIYKWPEMPNPNDYRVVREDYSDLDLHAQTLELQSGALQADRRAAYHAMTSRVMLGSTLAVMGIGAVALAPGWTRRVRLHDARVETWYTREEVEAGIEATLRPTANGAELEITW